MPRFARLWMPGSVQHLIVRFVNRAYRMAGAAERAEYLQRLGRTVAQTDWHVLAYALMSNHVHLCAVAGLAPAWQLMQPLHGGFALWLNHRDRALGPVFASRYSAIACAPAHVARLIAYIHNNPVRAGVVGHPEESAWTSHRAYLGHEAAPGWLDVEQGLAWCGFSGADARSHFNELAHQHKREPRDANLSGTAMRSARLLTRVVCGGPVEISDALYGDAGPQHEVRVSPGTPLRPRWPGVQAQVLKYVVDETGIALEHIQSPDKRHAVCQAKRLALLAWQRLGRTRVEMSTVLGLSAGTASHLVHRNPQQTTRAIEQVMRIVDRCWAQPGPE